jgi:hypothetical protein
MSFDPFRLSLFYLILLASGYRQEVTGRRSQAGLKENFLVCRVLSNKPYVNPI